MDHDTPAASWHPAMMPNSNTELAPPAAPTGQAPSTPQMTHTEMDFQSPEGGAFLDRFKGDDGADAWDISEPVTAGDAPPSAGEQPGPIPRKSTTNTPKHGSTVSFARTVSHDLNFHDDDDDETDSDWGVQRTDTDPFKFMPPNDRTNSFPPVPVANHVTNHQPPLTQAEDIMQDIEQEISHHDDVFADSGNADSQPAAESQQSASEHFLGGNVEGIEGDDSTGRFEEGMPLIPQNSQPEIQTTQELPAQTGSHDPFAEDDTEGGDDFFSQIQNGDAPHVEDDPSVPTLQRKTTHMAMGGLDLSGADSERPSPTADDSPQTFAKDMPQAHSNEGATLKVDTTDLDAKWAAALGDDDEDFLLESATENKEMNPADIFGSDDEGFLDDLPAPAPATANQAPAQPVSSMNGRYTPTPQALSTQTQVPPNPYAPVQSFPASQAPQSRPPAGPGMLPPPPKPEMPKAQSFSDKSKGGYQSPYDLPMDIVKPKKRTSMAQLRTNTAPPGPPAGAPPRSASVNVQPTQPTPPAGPGSMAPPPPPAQAPPKSKSGFFEDLPMSVKPRPASRQSSRSSQSSPYIHPSIPPTGPSQDSSLMPPPPAPMLSPPSSQESGIGSLVAPGRASPYEPLPSNSLPKPNAPPAPTNRYSPTTSMSAPPASTSRYSPAPPGSRPSSSGYGAAVSGIPPALPHQPRTSSPLAQFVDSREGGASLSRSSSGQYEPRLTRVPSLPPTQEVDEGLISPSQASPGAARPSPTTRYSPTEARQTPPPSVSHLSSALSPPKRSVSSYTPHNASRPSSSHVENQPRPAQIPPSTKRARGMSYSMNLVPPTDGRENDPLQRWRGAPVFVWGVGGTSVMSFPKDVPRYSIGQTAPMITRSPGEVKLTHIKEVQPLEEQLAKFPGPLKGKSKKKEVLAWLSSGIEGLERTMPTQGLYQSSTHEDKRTEERVLLWKILRVFVENDGSLEGSPTVTEAVRKILSLGPEADVSTAPEIPLGADMTSAGSGLQGDAVDPAAIEQIRGFLLAGDREKAAWAAADKRLWGHALLISNTSQIPDLYRKVSQEFIKKEVNLPGHNNESLSALYGVLSGNFEESVDELVPVHARAGFQLMATTASPGASQDTLAGLNKWRETLGLVLSNRSQADVQALTSLGNLLSSYGRAEAAHICYMFSRPHAIFGGLDDPNAHFVLVGADHRRQSSHETEALLLSEVYEFGLSLPTGSNAVQSCPHLAAYKLQHALTLAEYGYTDKALQYCDAIVNAMTAQTKRSQYSNAVLESSVDDLMKRLKQTPREETSSWIPKPSSTGMWNRFNKFVAGDDNENSGDAANGELSGESGPFARIGGTPAVSRSGSVTNFESLGAGGPSPTTQASRAGSRYAPLPSQGLGSPYEPGAPFNPAPSSLMGRSSGEMQRNSLDQSSYSNPYAPESQPSPGTSFQPMSSAPPQGSPYKPATPPQPYEPLAAAQDSPSSSIGQGQGAPIKEPAKESSPLSANVGFQPSPSFGYEPPSSNLGYQPPSMIISGAPDTDEEGGQAESGYEPPSFQPSSFQPSSFAPSSFTPSSFEPPSYEPGPMDEDSPQLRPKKSFMDDDDDDDIPALKKPMEKSKSDKDRENEEMFRRIAEQEAKQAAESKPAKKGWGLSGWFGGGGSAKKEPEQPKAVKAKLGEESSFVYDPDLKRWVNKKPGADNAPAKTATPPPPRSRNGTSTPPPPMSMGPPGIPGTPPPPMAIPKAIPALRQMESRESLTPFAPGTPPMMARSVSGQSVASDLAPLSRPGTALSNASSIDDLIGAAKAGPRKPKKTRKSGRYVDVMAK